MRCRHVRGRVSRLSLFGAMLTLSSLPAFSQTLGEVTGRITDSSGGAVAGANVNITNAATNAVRNTVTTVDGDYTFASVPPGLYNVRAEHPGFKTAEAAHLQVQ